MVAKLDFTSKDYEAFRQDMIARIPEKMPEWTDTSSSDPGIVILELLAYGLETLSYYNDRVSNEVFLDTAIHRKSVMEHCRKIDYELKWQTPARFKQVFEFEPSDEEIVLPRGFQVGTKSTEVEDSVIYELTEDYILPAGKTGLEQDVNGNYLYLADIEHGQSILGELVGYTTMENFQTFRLNFGPVLKESLIVSIDEGQGKRIWTPVTDFIASQEDSETYLRYMDEFDTAYIQLGNGISGKVPKQQSTVYADYKIGGGVDGNVGSGAINTAFVSIPGLLRTFNPAEAYEKGVDKESIESAKINAPASLKRMERYVTLDDYETGLKQDLPSKISKVKAVNVNGEVHLFILPVDGEILTSQLKAEVMALVEEKSMLFIEVEAFSVTFVPVNISVNLTIHSNYSASAIKFRAEELLKDSLSRENVEFGEGFQVGEIYKELLSIEGVRSVRITTPTVDSVIGETELSKLGTLQVTVGGV
jgi:uncharacterized phage protein gp47/JayE